MQARHIAALARAALPAALLSACTLVRSFSPATVAQTATVARSVTIADAPAREPSLTSYVREELYFGLRTPTGMVSDSAWADFLGTIVTPRFPNGLTVLHGHGQWRSDSGRIEEEGTHLLILVYPEIATRSTSAERRVREVIASYKSRFSQESVLRVTTRVRAAF